MQWSFLHLCFGRKMPERIRPRGTAAGVVFHTVVHIAWILALAAGCGTYVHAATTAQAPYFSPGAGTYKAIQTVTIADGTSGAQIYYTLDGTIPTTASSLYSGPITVATNQTVRAIAVASGLNSSAVATAVYTIALPAAMPIISPAGATYTSAQTVSMSDATAGAVIYYTTDGTTPTAASNPYLAPFTVGVNRTVLAIALAPGGSVSPVSRAAYTIQLPAATPVITPASGTFSTAQTVTISDATPGATIYYTLNGTMPNTASAKYAAPLTVSSNTTVKAVALATGGSISPLASAALQVVAATPVIAPAAGTYNATQTVVITDATPGVYLYYTTDGSTPTTASKRYTSPFTVNADQTVQAMAYSVNYVTSQVAAQSYSIRLPAAAPIFSPAGGTFLTARTVTLRCSTANAAIYYTTDKSAPTTSSALYSAPFSVASTQTVRAMAIAPQGIQGPTSEVTYTITPPAAKPVVTPAGGKFTSIQSVVLTDATPDAKIYYTTDGSTPTATSAVYTGPLTVAENAVVQAVALAPGGVLGPVAKATFTIQLPTEVPVFSPAPGTYSNVQTVSISNATPGAVIYYTLNGKYPTTLSSVYAGPIVATNSANLQAIAIAPSHSMSTAATGLYTIVTPAPTISSGAGAFDYSATVALSDSLTDAVIYYTTDGTAPTVASAVYRTPLVFSPTHTTTTQIRALAVAPNHLTSSISSAAVTVSLPPGVLVRSDLSLSPSMTIPPDFMGLSSDWTQPASLMGSSSAGVNRPFYQLLKNLTAYTTAPLLYRFASDYTYLSDVQTAVQPLAEMAQEVNVNYLLGVDLAHGSLVTSVSQALLWSTYIPNGRIRAFEIGNEPDLYAATGRRPASYNFSNYLLEYALWQQGLWAVLGKGTATAGPSDANSSWMASIDSALASGLFQPAIVTQHAYLSGPAKGTTLPADYLLQPTSVTKLPTGYAPMAAAAHKAGRLFRMGEINSVGGGGVAGISNSFSASLWSIDMMFQYLVNGMDGVNWHSGEYTQYAIAQFQKQPLKGKTQYTLIQVNPLYYGLWTFIQAAGRGAQLLPVHTMTDSNVSAWATVDNTSTVHVIVINKETTGKGNVELTVPGYSSGTVRYLMAPSYTANTGITLGGLTFDQSVDGLPVGTPTSTAITPSNDVFTVENLPAATAVLIDFTK